MKNVIREKRNFLPLINGVKFVKVSDVMSASEAVSDEVCESFLQHAGYREATEDDELPETVRPAGPAPSKAPEKRQESDDLEGLSVTALKKIAKKQKVPGYSQMDKPALIKAIEAEDDKSDEDGEKEDESDKSENIDPKPETDETETPETGDADDSTGEQSEEGGDDSNVF